MSEPKPSRAMEILKRVPGGADLIIRKEAAPVVAPVVNTSQETNKGAAAVLEQTKPVEVPPKTIESAYSVKPDEPVQKVEEPKKLDVLPIDVESEGVEEDPIHPKKQDFVNLRTKFKHTNKAYKETLAEKEALRLKVEEYETGAAVPDVVKAKDQRISELEKFEHLYNFRGTPAYREKYVQPIESEKAKIKELADGYKVDVNSLNDAFKAASPEEENRLLMQQFKDPVAVLEAKGLFKNIRKIQSDAIEAEKEPGRSLAQMQEENNRIVREKTQKAVETITTTSRSAWNESLVFLKNENKFPELIYKEGDTEHNQKYVVPILTQAAQEYAKIVRSLAEHGLTELPKELAIAIARMTKLSHHAAVGSKTIEAQAKRINELESLMKGKTRMDRPGINGLNNSSVSGPKMDAVGPMAAGKRALDRVMNKAN